MPLSTSSYLQALTGNCLAVRLSFWALYLLKLRSYSFRGFCCYQLSVTMSTRLFCVFYSVSKGFNSYFESTCIHMYKAEKPSVCLSVMPITHLGLPTSTYQLPKTINPSSSTSSLSPQVNAVIRLRSAAGWRRRSRENLSNIPSKTTAISMGRATDLHSGGCGFEFSRWTDFFFWKSILFVYTFF